MKSAGTPAGIAATLSAATAAATEVWRQYVPPVSRRDISIFLSMNTIQKKLASRLLYLPLDLNEKVLLWLTYRELKPVSEITVVRRNLALYRRLLRQGKHIPSSYDSNSSKIKRIRKWIQDAGMSFIIQPKYETSWHVSRDKNKAMLSAKIIRKFDYKNEYKSGVLFGFPKKSVLAYAKNRTRGKKKQIPMIEPFSHRYFQNKYFTPYIFYAIRADAAKEDCKTAKLWANTIRTDIPLLAKWFERK